MQSKEVFQRITEIGIVPCARGNKPEQATFSAEAQLFRFDRRSRFDPGRGIGSEKHRCRRQIYHQPRLCT